MKTKKIIALLFVFLSASAVAQMLDLDSVMRMRNEYYFSFDTKDLRTAQGLSQMVSIDALKGDRVLAYANNEEYEAFKKTGIVHTLLTPPSMMEKPVMGEAQKCMSDWDAYPTYGAYEQMMAAFASAHPDKCRIDTLGVLDSGHKILVARLCDGNPVGRPKFLYSSTMHGDETTGFVLLLRLIDYLLNDTSALTQSLMSNIDISICPLANPDGTYRYNDNSMFGATRNNANGIDLNRNFNDPEEGPHPGQSGYALETQWFMQQGYDNLFTMSANFHGGAEVVNYPWDTWQKRHADDGWYIDVSRGYADTVHVYSPSNYMDYLQNGITNGYDWYTISGSRQDFMNYFAGCRELTIEVSDVKMPQASALPDFWNYNKMSMLYFMKECVYGLHGRVCDSASGAPVDATIFVQDHDADGSWVATDSLGYYHRPIGAGTYMLKFSAEGYNDTVVSVTVGNNQTVVCDMALTPLIDRIEEVDVEKTIHVFPNPANGYADIQIPGNKTAELKMYDLTGRLVLERQMNGSLRINLSDIEPGVYFVAVTVDGVRCVRKLTVRQ